MAETVSTFNELIFDLSFVDGDERTQKLQNPRDNITVSEITELQTFCQANNALVGDKIGATFGRIKRVARRRGTTTDVTL